ncbi:hypothetical protein Moror_10374 [Moniliophthora roreri MCA 2997]|uniref:Transmembrane protein n=2 Tax=Moniliophthora roreri TaxID=221103 RepID=V2WYJ3_MONRO|nr:hypothetical protein Moror_10374 [Moniliophthora roreri MCA 2997]KAI3601331.1 hypothetical protein WG66_013295 [Moniliophthora roreri]
MTLHQPNVPVSLPSLLVATWVSLVLYTFELALGCHYIYHSSKRSSRWAVATSLFAETLCTIVICIHGYNFFFVYTGLDALVSWNVVVIVILTQISIMIEQFFFTYRYWTLSCNVPIVLTIMLAILLRGSFVIISVIIAHVTHFQSRAFEKTSIIASAALSAFTDLTIAILLVLKLNRIKVAYASIQGLLIRLSIHSVLCGFITALTTILKMLLLFFSLDGYIFISLASGRIYTLTVLLNFVILRRFKSNSAQADSPEPTEIDFRNLNASAPAILLTRRGINTTIDSYLDENGQYKRPDPVPAFSMESL